MSDEQQSPEGEDDWGDPGSHTPYGWSQGDVDRWIEINQRAGKNWQTAFKAAEAAGYDLRGGDPRAVEFREKLRKFHQKLVDKHFTPAHIKALDDNLGHGDQLDLQSARWAQRRGEPLNEWQREILARDEGLQVGHAPAPKLLPGMRAQAVTPAQQPRQAPQATQAPKDAPYSFDENTLPLELRSSQGQQETTRYLATRIGSTRERDRLNAEQARLRAAAAAKLFNIGNKPAGPTIFDTQRRMPSSSPAVGLPGEVGTPVAYSDEDLRRQAASSRLR